MTESRASTWWMTAAVVGAALLALFSVVVGAVNYERLEHQSRQRAHDRDVQIAQAKAQSDAQVAQAKAEAARQVAVAKAEVQAELCGLAGLFPPSDVLARVKAQEHCAAISPTSTSGAAAGSNRLDQPGRTSTTAAPAPSSRPGLTSPQPRPSSSPPPHPSMSPPPTPLLCLIQPIVQIGACP